MADEIKANIGDDGKNIAAGKGIEQKPNTNNNTINVNESQQSTGYTLADLRWDVRILQIEFDRLKDDWQNQRRDDTSLSREMDTMEKEIGFLRGQIDNMLLLKPVPQNTPVVPLWAFNVLAVVLTVLAILAIFILVYLARGRL